MAVGGGYVHMTITLTLPEAQGGTLSFHPASTFAGGTVLFGSIGVTTTTTVGQSLTNDLVRAHPWWCPESMTIDEMGMDVTIAGATSNSRLGIYEAGVGPNKYPTTLRLDAGAAATDTVGFKSIAVNHRLAGRRYYWLAMLSGGSTLPSMRAAAASARAPVLGVSATAATFQVGISHTQAYGALPATFPASAPALLSSQVFITLRRSA